MLNEKIKLHTLSESDPEKSPTLLGLLLASLGRPLEFLAAGFRERFPLAAVFQLNSVLTEFVTSKPTVPSMVPDIGPTPSTKKLPPQVLQDPSPGWFLLPLSSGEDAMLPGQVHKRVCNQIQKIPHPNF